MTVVELSLDFELLEDLDLMVERLQIEGQEGHFRRGLTRADSPIEPVSIAFWFIGLETGVGPIALEARLKLLEKLSRVGLRKPDVPFTSLDHGRVREVRRTDVGRGEAGVAVEKPRLGVKPG